jgi:plasmid stability protein
MSLMARLDTLEEVRRIYDELTADGGHAIDFEPYNFA